MQDRRPSHPSGRSASGTRRPLGRHWLDGPGRSHGEPDPPPDRGPRTDGDPPPDGPTQSADRVRRIDAADADRFGDPAVPVPTDDAIGGHPDRQVLVVGATVVGTALALVLRRAGYDPLVVAGGDASPPSGVTTLPPPALGVLDAVGVGATVRRCGVAVRAVSVRGVDSTGATDAADSGGTTTVEASSVLVRTRSLRRTLEARLGDRQRRRDTPIAALAPREDGVAVEFADGVREWFDVVVDAGGLDPSVRPADRPPVERATLVQYETATDGDPDDDRIRERWHDGALVQRLPRPGEPGQRVRVTAPAPDRGPGADEVSPRTVLPDDAGVAGELDGVEPTTVRQVRVAGGPPQPGSWGSGRVAACGPVACPVAPATGFRTQLGVEDAIAFARAVTRADRSASAVVDAYAAGRARRLATLFRTAAAARPDHEYPVPDTASPLAPVALLRTVPLGPALCERLAAVGSDGVR
ncbi:FAD-dependent oxidoreductase [Halosimplex halobium]|uniref:FAD-dependent oxidoreductase n=1 Tax=Halosimplex halobium TaxID=3396618 RepID=UPI003F562F25